MKKLEHAVLLSPQPLRLFLKNVDMLLKGVFANSPLEKCFLFTRVVKRFKKEHITSLAKTNFLFPELCWVEKQIFFQER